MKRRRFLSKAVDVAWTTPVILSVTLPSHAQTSCQDSMISINNDEFTIDFNINGEIQTQPVLEIQFQKTGIFEFQYSLEKSNNLMPSEYSIFEQGTGGSVDSFVQRINIGEGLFRLSAMINGCSEESFDPILVVASQV